MMMLDIDGILTRYGADTTEVLAAAQQMAVSAVGHLVNQESEGESEGQVLDSSQRNQATCPSDSPTCPLDSLADAIAEQIRTALHKRIAEGPKPDW